MQVTVTAEAMPTVRRMIVGYGSFDERAEVVEIPGVDDLAREVVDRPEALDQQRDERSDVDEEEGGDAAARSARTSSAPAAATRAGRASGGLPGEGSPPSDAQGQPPPAPASP